MINSKERLLLSIKGQETDRLAWSPFLPYFWESLPQSIQKKGMLDFYKSIGADPLFRGFCTIINKTYSNVDINVNEKDGRRKVTYETPVGNLEFGYVYAKESKTWFLKDHPLKSEEDYKILTYINEDMTVLPNYTKYENGLKVIGDEGLLIPITGSEMKSSFQSLVENWAGTVELTYALYDYPETVKQCLDAMKVNSKKAVEIACECDADAFIFWEDSSTTNISPNQFETYVMDEIKMWADLLHDNDKYLIHHACGLIKDLIPLMAKTGIDMIESISPPPTGNIYTYEAREILPDNIGLIGGIEPTVLLNSSMDELEKYVRNIIEKTGKTRFILGNSDSCPPGVEIDKFKMISEIVKEY